MKNWLYTSNFSTFQFLLPPNTCYVGRGIIVANRFIYLFLVSDLTNLLNKLEKKNLVCRTAEKSGTTSSIMMIFYKVIVEDPVFVLVPFSCLSTYDLPFRRYIIISTYLWFLSLEVLGRYHQLILYCRIWEIKYI